MPTAAGSHRLQRQMEGADFLNEFAGLNVPSHGKMLGWGATVPADAATGWGKGALFIHRDGASDATLLYVNVGSTTSADFDAIDPGAEVTATDFNAGASGTAGTVDIFPTTAAMGRMRYSAADSAGDTITEITNASQAAARTYTIPDAGADADFVMTEGTQTISGAKTFDGAVDHQATFTVGVDDTGFDVTLYGATAGAHLLWDESADTLKLVGGAATDMQGTLTVGVDDTGYDVTFFGATSGSSLLWDESADALILTGATADLGTSCEADAYTVGGVAGVDFGPSAVTSLTVTKGIVTAAS